MATVRIDWKMLVINKTIDWKRGKDVKRKSNKLSRESRK